MFYHGYRARAGDRDAANAVLEELRSRTVRQYVLSLYFADVYAGLDDKPRTLEWLERSYKERNAFLATARVNRIYDRLHEEPAFIDLLKRIRLLS